MSQQLYIAENYCASKKWTDLSLLFSEGIPDLLLYMWKRNKKLIMLTMLVIFFLCMIVLNAKTIFLHFTQFCINNYEQIWIFSWTYLSISGICELIDFGWEIPHSHFVSMMLIIFLLSEDSLKTVYALIL